MSSLQMMDDQIALWESTHDKRAVFLRCYRAMTANMQEQLKQNLFLDQAWVQGLVDHFARYYFRALDLYEQGAETPAVWRQVHDITRTEKVSALQLLLMGVNAHINFDLVLALSDVMQHDWTNWSEEERLRRKHDHERVNMVIAGTIDSVQDTILEPAQPFMAVIDRAFGRLDEYLLSRLISNWREDVWSSATRLLNTTDAADRKNQITDLEESVLKRTRLIGMV